MKEGTDYIIRSDPKGGEEDWVVLLSDPFDRLVCRYRNIKILGKGKTVSFEFEVAYCPKDFDLIGREEELQYTLGEILVVVLQEHHEKRANIYYSMETGERVNYE